MFLNKTILGITSYLLTTNGQDAMCQKLEIWDIRKFSPRLMNFLNLKFPAFGT